MILSQPIMMASKDITFMSGENSNFKFKLGDVVVPALPKQLGFPIGPSTVTGLQLNGYVIIEPIGTPQRLLVEAKDYERFEGEAVQSDDSNTPPPSGG